MVRKSGASLISSNKRVMQDLYEEYNDLCFENYISLGTGYTEAAAQALPVFLSNDDNSKRVAEQYKEVTKEFLKKIE